MDKFRALRADEVECRVSRIDKKESNWLSLLLYKDARCDQNNLDETVGPMNWQRHHSRENANCVVSIWDSEKGIWVEKEDTGTESNTEAAKGLASDSFKRACFNWGIGRELYTAPTIFIRRIADSGQVNYDVKQVNGKLQPKADFYVADMEVQNGRITYLRLKNRKQSNRVVFTWGNPGTNLDQQELPLPETEPEPPAPPAPSAPAPQQDTGPKPYTRKGDVPPEEQDTRTRAFELFKAKYPQAKFPARCFKWIFGTSKETTEEEWKIILDCVFRGDYVNNVAEWNAQLKKEKEAKA